MSRTLGWALALGLVLAAPATAGDRVWTPLGGPGMPGGRVLVDPSHPETLYALVAVPVPEQTASLWKSTGGGDTWRSIQEGIGGPVDLLAIDPLRPERLYAWQTADYSNSSQSRLWGSDDGGDTWSVRFTPSTSDSFFFRQIVPSPVHEGTLYAWTEGNGSAPLILRSTDGGATWQRRGVAGSAGPASLEPLSHHPGRDQLEFLDGRALYTSVDGGLTWTPRGSYRNQGFSSLARSAAAPDRLYARPTDYGPCLVRSDDGGAHWRKLRPPILPGNMNCNDVAVDPRDPDLVRVVASGQVGRRYVQMLATSRDGGATWSKLRALPTSEVVPTPADDEILFAGSTVLSPLPGLFKSTDGGESWAPSWDGIANGDLRLGLAAVPAPRQRLTLVALAVIPGVSSDGRLVRSVDRGKTWELVASSTETYADLETDAADQILYALRRDGQVVKSLDRGLTWIDGSRSPTFYFGSLFADPFLSGRVFGSLFDIPPTGYNRTTVWRTTDFASTWARRSAGLPIVCAHIGSIDYCSAIGALTSDPRDSARVLMAFGVSSFLSDESPVYVSTDGGTRWHLAAQSPPAVYALAADPDTPGAFLAGTLTGGILRSEDGGEHWTAFGTGLPVQSPVRQLLRASHTGVWYAVTQGQGVFRSTDGGRSWSDISAGLPDLFLPQVVIEPGDADHLFAAVRGQGVWEWNAHIP